MLMRAGLSYSDWRQMAGFQRMDYAARNTLVMRDIQKRLKAADSMSDFLGILAAKILGMF